MPWFIQNHRAQASTLTHVEHSVLCYLQMLFWQEGGAIPNDDRWIAKRVRQTPTQWRSMRGLLLQHCIITKARITHPQLSAEFCRALANVEQKRKAGQASAAARRGQRAANVSPTDERTAVQPHAGRDKGNVPYPVSDHDEDVLTAREQFKVYEGGR
jgi:uncharacterized protein YdaU (DUF1376 family)